MEKSMKQIIIDLIQDAISDEFWNEDSVLVGKYYEETGQQLDCEGVSTALLEDGSLEVFIGFHKFNILIK